jgi:hypothetical protein
MQFTIYDRAVSREQDSGVFNIDPNPVQCIFLWSLETS